MADADQRADEELDAQALRERDACCQLLEAWGYGYIAARIREERRKAEDAGDQHVGR